MRTDRRTNMVIDPVLSSFADDIKEEKSHNTKNEQCRDNEKDG
jgi:hypothetical protein